MEHTNIGSSIKASTKKPPVGLRPRYVVQQLRLIEILEAFMRYVHEDIRIPDDWIREFAELNSYIEE